MTELQIKQLEQDELVIFNKELHYFQYTLDSVTVKLSNSIGQSLYCRYNEITRPELDFESWDELSTEIRNGKFQVQIIPKIPIKGVSLSTMGTVHIQLDEIVTVKTTHRGVPPFLTLEKIDGTQCILPYFCLKPLKSTPEKSPKVKEESTEPQVRYFTYYFSSLRDIMNVFSKRQVRVRFACGMYFCSRSQFDRKMESQSSDKIFVFYKPSVQTIIISNGLKKGAVWNERCAEFHDFSLFTRPMPDRSDCVAIPSPTSGSVRTSVNQCESTEEEQFFKKPVKRSNVRPLDW